LLNIYRGYNKDKIEYLQILRIPNYQKKFKIFLEIIREDNLDEIMRLLNELDIIDRNRILKALSFSNKREIFLWSLKDLKLNDLWEIIADPGTSIEKLWLIFLEMKKTNISQFEMKLFFACIFEKMKNELIWSSKLKKIKIIKRLYYEFLKFEFSAEPDFSTRFEEIFIILKKKMDIIDESDIFFEKLVNNLKKRDLLYKKEDDFPIPIKNMLNKLPWVQLQFAKAGYFQKDFICHDNYYIAKAALEWLHPSETETVLHKKIKNYQIFFELADNKKFFTEKNAVKALLKYSLAQPKHYEIYRKGLNNIDLKEIYPYANPNIKRLIKNDLNL
jgi:hypothetical protein